MHSLADLKSDRPLKDRSVMNEAVIFAIFTAGIHAGRQLADEGRIQRPANIALFQLSIVRAADDGFETPIEKFLNKNAGVFLPQRENARHCQASEQALTPLPKILEENVAEDDIGDTLVLEGLQRRAQGRHIVVVAAPPADIHFVGGNAARRPLQVALFLA